MKKVIVATAIIFIFSCAYSQSVVQVKCKDYKGYIFPKEHSIWGLTPEYNWYTPSIEDIAQAEKILRTFVRKGYINTNKDGCCKVPINKRTLKKYMRQYVGYLTERGNIIIHIFLNKDIDMDKNNLSEDILAVFDGEINHWSIKINISTEELFDLQINGIG